MTERAERRATVPGRTPVGLRRGPVRWPRYARPAGRYELDGANGSPRRIATTDDATMIIITTTTAIPTPTTAI
ncbi:hypothetical protein ACL02O_27235, partial [Micromonospora sp. MS34]|uniref:hypothetical protein n=1 Tax=Micromonospora sp. MS34 TaxID=3385971 RepID=UPI0039A047A0